MELVFQTWAFRTDTGTCIGPEIADGNEVKTRSLLQNHTLWICGAYYLVYQGIEGKADTLSLRNNDCMLTVNKLLSRTGLYFS